MICRSLPRRFSRLPSRRISSSTSHSRLWASSTMRTVVRPAAARSSKHVVEREQYFGLGEAVASQVEIVSQEFEKLLHGEAGIEQRREADLLRVEIIAQALQHGGLAGAHFAGQGNEALAALYAVHQAGEGFFVLGTPEQEGRVRAHVERVLGETEEGVVHVHRIPAERSRLSGAAPSHLIMRRNGPEGAESDCQTAYAFQ